MTGEVFCFCNIRIFIAIRESVPVGGLLAPADEVLLREGPYPFETQNASLHHRRSLAATNHLLPFRTLPAPYSVFMTPALGCSLALSVSPNPTDRLLGKVGLSPA